MSEELKKGIPKAIPIGEPQVFTDIRVAKRKMQEYIYDLEDYVKFLEVLSEQMNFTFRKL